MTNFEQYLSFIQPVIGEDYPEYVQALDAPLSKAIRVNTTKISADNFCGAVGTLSKCPYAQEAFIIDKQQLSGNHPYHHAGLFYMQEPSAMSVATLLKPYVGKCVLDMCAAPGGKSTQIYNYLDNDAVLYCNEYVYARAKQLLQNIERMGLRRTAVLNNPPHVIAKSCKGYFDTIIVDAPCSGEGMFRKNDQALSHWSMENVQACSRRQKDILEQSAQCLSGGGHMIYSTCTLNTIENEDVIMDFLATHSDYELIPLKPDFAHSKGQKGLNGAVRLFPHRHLGEGHFVALLHKFGDTHTTTAKRQILPQTTTALTNKTLDLWSQIANIPPLGSIHCFGEGVYMIDPQLPYFNNLNYLRLGIKVASIVKDRLEPHHNAVTCLQSGECANPLEIAQDSIDILKYLQGECLYLDKIGYGVVTCDGYPVGLYKGSDGQCKNHYPKGLRIVNKNYQ